MHPLEEDHQFNRILASFSPLSYQQQEDIALRTMVSKDQYDTIPSEDTTLLPSSLTPPDEGNHRNYRNRLTTLGAAILVVIGLSFVAKCPHRMEAFQALKGGKAANFDMLGLGQTDGPTVSPTLSPTVSPTVSPTLSPTVSPTVSPTLSPTLSPVAKD